MDILTQCKCTFFVFSMQFHWSLFLVVKLIIGLHLFRKFRRQTITWTHDDPAHWGAYASPGLSELGTCDIITTQQCAEKQCSYLIKHHIFSYRVIWVLIVCAGVITFGVQIAHNVATFLEYHVTVNVKINYNTSLEFPAVSLCNQNDFR